MRESICSFMAQLYELDWGYTVRVNIKENVKKEGVIVYGYRTGRIGLSFRDKHRIGAYDLVIDAALVEIVHADDRYKLKEKVGDQAEDIFEGARRFRRI
ncbi:MAG: hypothetical protein QT02_C0003G0034 [archaeon GW2011_AR9]|nr:MAG: hypothetical protein QT02_C0003G0034 [archaeon GW2011_AR9]